MSIATSKELHFNADFKYISFIKFSLTHQKLRAWENLPSFRKQGEITPKNHRIITKIPLSHSAYQRTLQKKISSSYLQKCGISYFLPEDRTRVRVYLFFLFLFFFPGVIVSTKWSQNLARGLILTEMKSSIALFK